MNDSGLQKAQHRIQQAHQKGATSLDLSRIPLDDEQLAALMPEIAQLTNLTTLYLTGIVLRTPLLTMEQSAPDWTAHHRLPRILVGELLTRVAHHRDCGNSPNVSMSHPARRPSPTTTSRTSIEP
jgi:hypothetical protein